MAQAKLVATAADQFAVSGELSFATVTALLQQSRAVFADAAKLTIDLAGVTHADSAGLSLLLEWLRYGKHHDKPVQFHNMPAQLRSLAEISEVQPLFGNLA